MTSARPGGAETWRIHPEPGLATAGAGGTGNHLDAEQPDEHGQKARGIHEEAGCGARRRPAAPAPPEYPGEIEGGGVERDGAHRIAPGQIAQERLPDRNLECADQPRDQGERVHPLDRDGSKAVRSPSASASEKLQQQQRSPFVHPPGHHATVEREQQDRQRAEERDQADLQRVGQLEGEPPERHRLHPGAAERDELTDDEEPEIRVAEGAEGLRRCRR